MENNNYHVDNDMIYEDDANFVTSMKIVGWIALALIITIFISVIFI